MAIGQTPTKNHLGSLKRLTIYTFFKLVLAILKLYLKHFYLCVNE